MNTNVVPLRPHISAKAIVDYVMETEGKERTRRAAMVMGFSVAAAATSEGRTWTIRRLEEIITELQAP